MLSVLGRSTRELLSAVALTGKSGRKLFLAVHGSFSLPFNLCVALRESIPLKFHYLPNVCLKGFSRESPPFKELVFGPDDLEM